MKTFFFTLLFVQQLYAQDMSSLISHTDISDNFLSRIENMFPERQIISSQLLGESQDPTLSLDSLSDVSITFLGEGAGYRNSFGYYLLDNQNSIYQQSLIFSNASLMGSGGSLLVGDTVNLGQFNEGTTLGFYVQANGFRNPNGNTYYTTEDFNADGINHVASYYDTEENKVVYGFEDLWNGGDEDYNDLIMTVQSTPVESIARAAISAEIYFDQPMQTLSGADGMVTMSVGPFAKVTGLDDIIMYATNPSEVENMTFIGQDTFHVESNTGVEVVVAITELTNENESVPVLYNLDGQGHQIFTTANQTHNETHQLFLTAYFNNITQVTEGTWLGNIVVTISHY